MNPQTKASQRVVRLAPLHEIYAAVDRCVGPLPAGEVETAAALGRTLAADIVIATNVPAAPIAISDGWAVRAETVADAGPYAPMPLSPVPQWVESGEQMPAGRDAVLPPDCVVAGLLGMEAVASVTPGQGVAAACAEVAAAQRLYSAGRRVRASDIAVFRAAGIGRVVIRTPRVSIFSVNTSIDEKNDTVGPLLAAAIADLGGEAVCGRVSAGELAGAVGASDADAIVTIGGTGTGRSDGIASAIAAAGSVIIHGMGIRPGDTAGIGTVGARPVLFLPGRLDAALAIWLVVGRRLTRRLTSAAVKESGQRYALTRKIASTVGLAEVVLVRAGADRAEPLAVGAFPLHAIASATGWVLVPPESEGYPVGASVEVHPLP